MRSRRSTRPEPGDDATALLPQRSDVGFVFQHYAPFKHLSIWDNVAFGLKVRKTAKPEMRERVSELLELVHLEKFAARYPAQPSCGQRQRMVLARTLAVQPRVAPARRTVRRARRAGARRTARLAATLARPDP